MLLYNNKKDNRNEHRMPFCDAWFQLTRTNPEYNASHAYFTCTLAMFVCILETLNK